MHVCNPGEARRCQGENYKKRASPGTISYKHLKVGSHISLELETIRPSDGKEIVCKAFKIPWIIPFLSLSFVES